MEIICYVKWKPFKIFKQLRYKMFFQLVFRSFLTFYKLIICCSCCSVAKSCLTLCDPMNCSTPGFPVLHYLQEFAQTHVYWVCDAIQPSHPLSPPLPALNLSQHQVFFCESALRIRWPKYWSFSFTISPSSEFQGWFPLGLTGLISLLSKTLERVFSNTTIQKHQFFGT